MNKRTAIIDIETNGFIEEFLDYSDFPYKFNGNQKVWCVVVRDFETGEYWSAELEEVTLEWLKTTLEPYYYIVAHRGLKFDFPFLKLEGLIDYKIGYLNKPDLLFGKERKILDSEILSRLSNPDRPAHSLKYWGKITNQPKDNYRQQCIEAGYIDKNAPDGAQFKEYNPLMLPYCVQDCKTNAAAFNEIMKYFRGHNWKDSIQIEHKLADLAFSREHLGFGFDKDLALECLEDLNNKLKELGDKVLPLIPEKPLNQSELTFWTPPKKPTKIDGSLSAAMVRFLDNTGAVIKDNGYEWGGKMFKLDNQEPLRKTVPAEMKDLDHIKMHLISLGWVPTEWGERDLTKDSKKKSLSFEKRVETLDRWWKKLTEKKQYYPIKFKELNLKESVAYEKLYDKLDDKWPVRVPTTPKIKVGVTKELCPNLIKLGDKVEFAKDFAMWLTYRHRRNAIAGGDLDGLDFEDGDTPSSGFLKNYREVDGRIPTPAIEIGAVTNRYTHINVANIPRITSEYGWEMRSLFTSGDAGIFFGFDYASLEARIMAHYVYRYEGGPELGELFMGEKPNDWHTSQSKVMGISRSDAKSVDYGLIYGAQIKKIMKMLGCSENRAKEIYNLFWDNSPALRDLRDAVIKYWESTGKKYVLGIDGRKINVRSKHALLNSLFQSAGIIYAKYISVCMMEKFENLDLCISPFEGKPDVCSMIEYHDEQDMLVNPELFKFKTFKTKEAAKEFESSWEGEQLSAIGESDKGFYVTYPNVVSNKITETMLEVEKKLDVKVPMGYEYMLGKNWAQCH